MQEDLKIFADFERDLAALQPATLGVRRDELLFAAGRAAGRRSSRIWQASTGVLLLLLAGLGAMNLRTGPGPQQMAQPRPAPPPQSLAAVPDDAPAVARIGLLHFTVAPNSYIALRNQVLTQGVGALPKPTGGGAEPALPADLLQGMSPWQRRALQANRS